MKHASVSLVITVRNEAHSIEQLFISIAAQSRLPDEVVVVDGGSTDATAAVLEQLKRRHPKLHIRIVTQAGNIAVGRNAGITAARYDWIASTDAGCVAEPNWLAELLAEQQRSQALVVAGFAVGDPQTPFEAAVVPYALVPMDAVVPEHYLPATRSMLLHRSVWQQLSGFPEAVEVGEDYAFARAARRAEVGMSFTKFAVVRWRPRSTLRSFFRMVYQQARDDIRVGNWRPKVGLVWMRYVLAVAVVGMICINSGWALGGLIGFGGATVYAAWAVGKNYRYVSQGWYWLPVLQVAADVAVMGGSIVGLRYR